MAYKSAAQIKREKEIAEREAILRSADIRREQERALADRLAREEAELRFRRRYVTVTLDERDMIPADARVVIDTHWNPDADF